MNTTPLKPADEQPHTPVHDTPWEESWTFDFTTPDASLGGFVRLTLRPEQGACWYWACLVGPGRDPVVVIDYDVPPPRNNGLEIRAHGLWADHIVESAFDHVSVGCEAFALGLDDPDPVADPRKPLLGDRTPFGLDLGWETDGDLVATPDGYALPCQVIGVVLVGDDQITLDAHGWRTHHWGPEDHTKPHTTTYAHLSDGTHVLDTPVVPEPVAAAPAILHPAGSREMIRYSRTLHRVASPLAGVAWLEAES